MFCEIESNFKSVQFFFIHPVYESLLYIFNFVLVTGIFPDDLKQSRVTPIFKDGDNSECGNY